MPNRFISDLTQLTESLLERGTRFEPPHLTQVADLVSKIFAVQPDEVALLALTADEKFLRFWLLEKLQAIGQIPLTSTASLAARTAREKRPELLNHFIITPHASVFEAVPLKQDRGEPIQKIMSAPIVLDARVVGVLQVSRKARNAAAAGPDFTSQELRELVSVAEILAPALPAAEKAPRPEGT